MLLGSCLKSDAREQMVPRTISRKTRDIVNLEIMEKMFVKESEKEKTAKSEREREKEEEKKSQHGIDLGV